MVTNIEKVAEALNAKILYAPDLQKQITGVYIGDFLSRVISKAAGDCAWLTIMSNINVAGVASLADIGVIVLCEGVIPDKALLDKCTAQDISIIGTELSAFDSAKQLSVFDYNEV